MERVFRRQLRGTTDFVGHYCVTSQAASRTALSTPAPPAHASGRGASIQRTAGLAAAILGSTIFIGSTLIVLGAPTFWASPAQAQTAGAARSTVATPAPGRLAAATAKEPVPAKARASAVSAPLQLKGTEQPKPSAATRNEAQFVAALDAAIAEARATDISTADATRLRDAFSAITAQNLPKAAELQSQLQDPLGRKLIDWFRLRSGYGEAGDYRAFLDANPVWPDRTLLIQRLEESLFVRGGSAAAIRGHFAGGEPRSGVGMAALASALQAEGDTARAKDLAARAWRDLAIPASLEQGFLERFKPLLTEADHKWRLDKLLMDDIRWTGERNAKAAFVRRLIPLLSAPEQQKAEARLAVYLRSADASKLMAAVSSDTASDWGFVLSRIQLLRRSNRHDEAARLLLGAPTDARATVSPDDWWEERRANAYEALDAGKAKLAYDLVSDSGPLTVNPLKEQTFMAGWLALRYLKNTAAAETHFAQMRKAADGPLSRAKADYWLARTAEAKGDTSKARDHFQRAAGEVDTFHGQLARQRLEPGRRPLPLQTPALPTSDQIARFNGLDAVKAVVVARKSGLESSVTRAFLYGLRNAMETEAEVALVTHLAEALGDTQTAVRIAKTAVARGQNLHIYSYPVHPFPAYTALRKSPEAAMLLAIARQESEFNTLTVSGAGARGLLQVMPITAQHVCRDYKIRCDIPRLLTDMSYNTSLASAYIADRMDEFQGSYVLAIAGYNAGPGRARQWIAKFGDPRDPKVDPIDWIERIPFQETREYVAKVMSNIQIYRARLGDATAALQLEDDLLRARGRSASAPMPLPSDAAAATRAADQIQPGASNN